MSCSEVDRRTTTLDSIIDAVGQTPCVRMSRLARACGLPDSIELIAKCEFLNPGGSVKDRIGRFMILEAERKNVIHPGDTLVEATSGNTGIGMSMAAVAKGYKMIITMPMKMSHEKQTTVQGLGAKVIRTPTAVASDHPDSLISVARRLVKENPETHHLLDQYNNPANPDAHEFGTGAEILAQCGGKVDACVIGTGTGGTMTGVARALKKANPKTVMIGADPLGSILADPSVPAPHVSYQVEGVGYDFVPGVLDRLLVDVWTKTEDVESFAMARLIHRTEGMLCGGSSGGIVHAAVKYAKTLSGPARIVVILPDNVRNYMTKFADDNWMIEKGFMAGEVVRPTYESLHLESEELKARVAQLEAELAAARKQ